MQRERGGQAVVRSIRRARRRHHLRQGDWVDSLYKTYMTVVAAGAGLFYGSLAVGGDRVAHDTLRAVEQRGPTILGALVAVVVAMGLRSGARGGPLAPEGPDVTYLLLAPISRTGVLRSLAWQQLRGVLLLPVVGGAIAGSIAAGKFGGSRWEWIVTGAAMGVLTAGAGWGAALTSSALRLGRTQANAVACGLLAWSALDVLTEHGTSPAAQLARVAFLPFGWSWLAVIGAASALALPAYGLVMAGSVSLEPLRRRAQLVGQLRFAATLQDMRSVVVLHRELAQELPRSRPWLRTPPRDRGDPCRQRDWHGLARWPVERILRVFALAAVVGLAYVGVWQGTDALVVLAGVALFLIGCDAVEGLAQESDHRERSGLFPVEWGSLVVRHLAAPAAVLVALGVVATATLAIVTDSATALGVGVIVLVPIALATTVGAAFSVVLGAPPPTMFLDVPLPYPFTDFLAIWLIVRQSLPPLLVTLAVVPVALAHDAPMRHGSTSGTAFSALFLPLILVGATVSWLRTRRLGRL